MWNNAVESEVIDDSIVRPMRFACWITKATNTHLEYVIRLAFPRQQWLRKRVSMLHVPRTCKLLSC